MSDNKITSILAVVVAAIITWGATVDRFFKAGMSAAMIAFSIDICIRNAFLAL